MRSKNGERKDTHRIRLRFFYALRSCRPEIRISSALLAPRISVCTAALADLAIYCCLGMQFRPHKKASELKTSTSFVSVYASFLPFSWVKKQKQKLEGEEEYILVLHI